MAGICHGCALCIDPDRQGVQACGMEGRGSVQCALTKVVGFILQMLLAGCSEGNSFAASLHWSETTGVTLLSSEWEGETERKCQETQAEKTIWTGLRPILEGDIHDEKRNVIKYFKRYNLSEIWDFSVGSRVRCVQWWWSHEFCSTFEKQDV